MALDPRDQTWEVSDPRYRVYFYDVGGASDEYEITGADVVQVLTWAEAQSHGRTFVVYACIQHDGFGLVRLAGRDPNDG